jgi:hypothetical protein
MPPRAMFGLPSEAETATTSADTSDPTRSGRIRPLSFFALKVGHHQGGS